MEVQFLVRIQNFSNKNYENYSLDFFVDGQKQEGKSDIELKAQEIKEIYFSYEFTTSGPHYISVVSSHDGLELDDRRFLAFHVFESISTLVVDGDPGKHPYESETHILMAALSPLPSDGEIPYIFKPDRIRANELDFKEFTPYQVVILANVETLSADVVERLESFVREGNSLLIFLGNKVLYPDYNQLLYNNGLGLLPLKLRGIAGEAKGSPKNLLGGNYVSYDPENYDHPLLKLFDSSPELAELLESKAPIYQYYTSEEPLATHKDVQVIARYTDPPVGTPAIIEKHFGNGKVILYTTTCDPDWNDLPAAVCYFPLMTETMQYLAHKEDHFQNVEVNHSLERTFPTLIREELEMVLPDEEEGTPTSATRVRLYLDHKEKESTMKVQFNQTSRIGIYEMTGIGEAAEKYRSFYGVNLKTSESDLSPISEKVLKELWGNNEKIKFLKVGASESHTALSNRKDIEYWKALLYCLLGCLLLETFLAQRLGNYSSR